MHDSEAVFEAFFKRVDDGYIFYPHRFARGISVTGAEHEQMVETFRKLKFKGAALIAFGIVLVILLTTMLMLQDIFSGGSAAFGWFILGAIFAGTLFWARHRNRTILQPVLGRTRDQPRRDSREFDVALGRAYGPMIYFWSAFFALQILLSSRRIAGDFSFSEYADYFFMALMLVGFLFSLRIAIRTWLANKAERR